MQVLVNIDVPNLADAIAFYEAALPLKCSRRLFGNTAAEMLGAACNIYLLEKAPHSAATPTDSPRHYGRHWTAIHPDFVVEEIDAATARAVAAGAQQETPIEDHRWGRLVTLSDPFGNGFCLVQFFDGIYTHAE